MSGPRAYDTAAFYTVRTKETKWQVQTLGKKDGWGECGECNQLITADHISLITFNMVIKSVLNVF